MSSRHHAGSCRQTWSVRPLTFPEVHEADVGFEASSPWHPDINIEASDVLTLRAHVEEFLDASCNGDGGWDASQFQTHNERLFGGTIPTASPGSSIPEDGSVPDLSRPGEALS